MRKALVVAFGVFALIVIACGGAEGDSCDEEGRIGGECDDGLICGKQKKDQTGSLQCLVVCETQVNCQADEECTGIGQTNFKGCRKD